MIMTEVKISYNNEEYTLEELLQKLSSSEEKIKELQSKVKLVLRQRLLIGRAERRTSTVLTATCRP